MKQYPWIKTKRGFVRDRRRDLKKLKKALDDIRRGCAIAAIYGDDTPVMLRSVHDIDWAILKIDKITKKLAK